MQPEVDIVLEMIKHKLPEKKFHISFTDISAELAKSEYSSLADNYNVSISHIFIYYDLYLPVLYND